MPPIDQDTVKAYIHAGVHGITTTEKGKALEDLICYLFGLVPGIKITRRNALNEFQTEEIDVALWNDKAADGFNFLSEIILIECKNWSNPVGSGEVNWFDTKLKNRGLNFGILVCANGITGIAADRTAAHQVISHALKEGRRLLVITIPEILATPDTDTLVHIIKEKLCDLAVSGTLLA